MTPDEDYFVGEGPPDLPPELIRQLHQRVVTYRSRMTDALWQALADKTVQAFEGWMAR